MMIRKSAFALLLLAAPVTALSAQDNESQERVDAVVRCIDVAPIEARVRCYDSAATALRDSLRTGEVAVMSRAEARQREGTPARVDATITSAEVTGHGGWRLVLSNGQTWQTYESQRRAPPPAGTAVRIRRNIIGSPFLFVNGYSQARVQRVD